MKNPILPSDQSRPAAGGTSINLFVALRDLLRSYELSFRLSTMRIAISMPTAKTLMRRAGSVLRAVKVSGRRHSFHFMPVYDFPDLLIDLSPALKKHMQGKSCFNFTSPDSSLLDELQGLVEQGAFRYKAVGKL